MHRIRSDTRTTLENLKFIQLTILGKFGNSEFIPDETEVKLFFQKLHSGKN